MTDDRLATVMAGVRGVVFDKDGTLVDLDTRWHPFFTEFVDGIVERSDDASLGPVLMGAIGLTEIDLVADGLAAVGSGEEIGACIVEQMVGRGHDGDVATASVVQAADASRFGPIEAIGDLAETVRQLAAHDLRLGIATSDGVDNTRDELVLLDLVGVFDPICCADDGGPVKPDPDVLLGVAAAWDVDVSEIVFVGDSRQDLATARAAGARFVARCPAGAAPQWATEDADAIISAISELAHAIEHRPTETEASA